MSKFTFCEKEKETTLSTVVTHHGKSLSTNHHIRLLLTWKYSSRIPHYSTISPIHMGNRMKPIQKRASTSMVSPDHNNTTQNSN